MSWVLEPGQSTVLQSFGGAGTITGVTGLPAGVSTRPALPADFAAGDELDLVASRAPAFGTFTLAFTVFPPDSSDDGGSDSDPGSGELPPSRGHGHPPSPRRPKPRPVHHGGTLLVRPASSEFAMSVTPAAVTVEQGGASTLDVRIDRTGATYRNPVSLRASADAALSVDPNASMLPGHDAVEDAHLTVRAASDAHLGGGRAVTVTATGNVAPPGKGFPGN